MITQWWDPIIFLLSKGKIIARCNSGISFWDYTREKNHRRISTFYLHPNDFLASVDDLLLTSVQFKQNWITGFAKQFKKPKMNTNWSQIFHLLIERDKNVRIIYYCLFIPHDRKKKKKNALFCVGGRTFLSRPS